MQKILLNSILLVSFAVYGQQIQWAHKLIKYSSDLGGKQYGIKRILGKPDVFPQAGNSPNAWNPKDALNGYQIVEVAFEKPQSVKQIAVFENLNAGCVVKVSLGEGDGKYKTVWSRKLDYRTPTFKASIPVDHAYYFKRKRRKIQTAPDVFNPGVERIILESGVSNISTVKVEFNFALLPGQKQVDAIGISDSDIPIDATISNSASFYDITASKYEPWNHLEVAGIAISREGNSAILTVQEENIYRVYAAKKDTNGQWSNPEVQLELNQNEVYNYVDFHAGDQVLKGGNTFTNGTGNSGYQFYKIENGSFKPGESVKVSAYANYGETSYVTATPDLKTLIFAIESDFSQGGLDLYFTTKKADGAYSLLQNMGKVVNSADDEVAVHLLSDGKTILYCSKGFSGYGDYDIFVSHRLDDTWKNWSVPVNLGNAINTVGFDGCPSYDESAETLYFVSWIEGHLTSRCAKISKSILQKN